MLSRRTSLSLLVAGLVLSGCGGGAGGGTNGGTPPVVDKQSLGTARVHVDLATNRVTVTPIDGGVSSHAVYSGSAIKFGGGTVSSEGSPERRTLQLTALNNTADTIDSNNLGLKVIFSEFRNLNTPPIDSRSDVTVTTYAGNGSTGTATGPVDATNVNTPYCIWRYLDGTILVADKLNNRILGVKDGTSNTVLVGETPAGMSGYVTPPGETGSWVLLCAQSSHTIKAFRPGDGSVRVIAGSGLNSSNDGTLANCTIGVPNWIAEDPAHPGIFYFIDSLNFSLRKLDVPGNSVTTIKTFGNAPFACGVVGGAVVVSFFASGQMVILNPNLVSQSLVLGGVIGYQEGAGSGVLFSQPHGLVVRDNAIIYCDAGNGRLRQLALRPGAVPYDANAWWGSTLAGNGVQADVDGTGPSVSFMQPAGIGAGLQNEVYVAEWSGQRIRLATAKSRFPVGLGNGTTSPLDTTVLADADGYIPSNNGKLPFYKEDGPFTAGTSKVLKPWHFILPEGLSAFDFVVTVEGDSPTLAALAAVQNPGPTVAPGSPNVNVRTFAGTLSLGSVDGPPSAASMGVSHGIAQDASGNLVFSDTTNHTIRRFDRESGQIITIVGRAGSAGSANGSGRDSRFSSPGGLVTASDGREIILCDTSNHTIRRLSNADGINDPLNWGSTTIVGLAGTAGNSDGTSGADARLNAPYAITQISPNVYAFTERDGNRVRTLSFLGGDRSLAANWRVSLLAGDNSATIGVPGLTDGHGNAAKFRSPFGIAMSPQGDLYVADRSNRVIRKVNTSGDVTTFAGSVSGYGDASGVSAKFASPTGIVVDSSGYIFVCDEGNNCIRRISPAGTVRTVAGSGDGLDDGSGATAKFTSTLRGMNIDPVGNLFVADSRRIRLVQRIISGN